MQVLSRDDISVPHVSQSRIALTEMFTVRARERQREARGELVLQSQQTWWTPQTIGKVKHGPPQLCLEGRSQPSRLTAPSLLSRRYSQTTSRAGWRHERLACMSGLGLFSQTKGPVIFPCQTVSWQSVLFSNLILFEIVYPCSTNSSRDPFPSQQNKLVSCSKVIQILGCKVEPCQSELTW